MKVGDLVLVNFPTGYEKSVVGIYVRDDTYATGLDSEGWTVITRGYVLWDGAVYSTPLDQLELICPALDDAQLENVIGGMSAERFDRWRAEKINGNW